ncbi:PIN domain-containing protein [Candidatus Sneabacter namystus]|uniref:Type II toxin-antitoxin system VapC family toxin n=1 Tax=Candidatus Sneabacter namystus TaxID=2601646 RepID=A0A5C0UHY9_9RICK|nr:type II toxin-antitoxin system VapC family toxin [Candidatus Sneabacter namystus]QEK39350.1 type II toxin-antitoxin system VapC family toxin [Candidatus Sneabacter namystus]
MRSKVVVDASSVIAVFAEEPGYDFIERYIGNALISSVNVAEVYKYCLDAKKLTSVEAKKLL